MKISANLYKSVKTFLYFSTYFIAFFFITVGYWINRYFGEPSFEQILYHLQFGSAGLIHADKGVLNSFFKWCILLPLFYTYLSYYIEKIVILLHRNGFSSVKHFILNIKQKFIKLSKKIIALLYLLIRFKLPIFLFIFSIVFFSDKIALLPYLEYMQNSGEDYFAQHYIDPKNVDITHIKKPKNLILIYVESLENTFADKTLFNENLLSELDIDKIGGQSFPKFQQAPATGWTIGGIVSSQCAIPLRALMLSEKGGVNNFSARSTAIKGIKNFMPGTICLGDILENNGYRNIFINGPDVSFAGVGAFLSSHGYHEVYDKRAMLDNGTMVKENATTWGGGLHDQELFALAKKIISKNEQADIPYNLTILTVDMHAPDGMASPKCNVTNEIKLANAIKCTSEGLADLIKWIKTNGYLENTNIAIMGDHLFMANEEQIELYFYKERNIFNRFISKDNNFKMNRDEILHFDILPTILYSLGFSFPDNKLGLGYSGFGDLTSPPAEDRIEEMNKKLMNYSSRYLDLWKHNDK